MNKDNEISEDFENLVGGKSDSNNGPANGAVNEQQMLQQRMLQQQMAQQQAQQQAQQRAPQVQIPPEAVSEKPVAQEGFISGLSVRVPKLSSKLLTTAGLLLALFYLFSSSQLSSVVSNIPRLSSVTSNEQVNLLLRGAVFVVVYLLVDRLLL